MAESDEVQINQLYAFYDKTTDYCMAAFETAEAGDVTALATGVMSMPGYPMHYPTHHYLVPAVLLTAARKKQGHGADVLKRDLDEALERALEVPGGFCGFQGACGAAVGTGIFWSIITDTAPTSKDSWAWGNRSTGDALLKLAEYGGPRCCKRCSWLSLQSTLPQVAEVLKLDLTASQPVCEFHEDNEAECLKERCPFYPAQTV